MGVEMKREAKKTVYFADKMGFTLVEIMLAIAIGLIIIGAISLSLRSGLYSSAGIEAKTTAQQEVRAAIEMMALEIGMASYNPTFTSAAIWRNPADCQNQSANPLRKGIQVATADSLTIEMDINNNSFISKDPTDPGNPDNNPNEIFAYVYDAANQRITRSTNCGGNFDLIGCIDANGDGTCDNNDTFRSVRVINDANTPVFRYFNGTGTEFAPNPALTTCIQNPANAHICNIRRIDITLAVESDVIDPMTKQRHKLIYSVSVNPRNHAINP